MTTGMEQVYTADKTFDRIDFTKTPLAKGEYENCVFKSCDFSNSDLSEYKFTDCEFAGCNLSMAKLTKTAFRDTKFKDCKLLGLPFNDCAEFGLSFAFDNCILNHTSFEKLKIKMTLFKDSQFQETDFTECDLTSSVFDKSNLEKTDFRTSYNYSIDPERNRIKKARFTLPGVMGLLDKYDIDIGNKI